MQRPVITLTTDFGSDSPYVAEMKASILSVAHRRVDVRIVDITHAIPSQNVRRAAFALHQVAPQFPAGTIHVAVIDPGVGTQRRIVAGRVAGQTFVCPDNGLLSLLLREEGGAPPPSARGELYAVQNDRYFLSNVSATFHGRDIMAPVAAHLACGAALSDLGPRINDPVLLEFPSATILEQGLEGELLWSDRFGNLISNLERGPLEACRKGRGWELARVEVLDASDQVVEHVSGIQRVYGDVPAGTLTALIGSSDRLELAVTNGSARTRLADRAGPAARTSSHTAGDSFAAEFRIRVTWPE